MNDSFDSVFDGLTIIWNFMLNIDIKLFFASDSGRLEFFETDSRKLRSNFLFTGLKTNPFFLVTFSKFFNPILAQAPIWCTQKCVRLKWVDFQLWLMFESPDLKIRASLLPGNLFNPLLSFQGKSNDKPLKFLIER